MSPISLHPQQFFSSVEEEYWTLRNSAGVFLEEKGFLHLTGAESVDFLQKLSTNDFGKFRPGSVVTTVFTTEKGRMIDLCTALYVDDRLILVTSFDAKEKVKSWLKKYIIMEDIQITDVTSEFGMVSVIGNKQDSLSVKPSLSLKAIENNKSFPLDNNILAFADTRFLTRKINIIGNLKVLANFPYLDDLLSCMPLIGTSAMNMLRIEEGIPIYECEITEAYNPLEASLDAFVSFTKGCYIGQEVIARLDTYKKLQRRLSGFSASETNRNIILEPGILFYNGEEVGCTTSCTWSPILSKSIALGYLKTGVSGSAFELRPRNYSIPSTVEITSLPFAAISEKAQSDED